MRRSGSPGRRCPSRVSRPDRSLSGSSRGSGGGASARSRPHKIGDGARVENVPVVLRTLSKRSGAPYASSTSSWTSKFWADNPPAVAAVRPARCPCCEHPGAPAAGPIGLVGHGTRERTLLGPPGPDRRPEQLSLLLRRYRCRGCGAVVVSAPRGVLRGLLYGAAAVALALGLWADGLAGWRVREQNRREVEQRRRAVARLALVATLGQRRCSMVDLAPVRRGSRAAARARRGDAAGGSRRHADRTGARSGVRGSAPELMRMKRVSGSNRDPPGVSVARRRRLWRSARRATKGRWKEPIDE